VIKNHAPALQIYQEKLKKDKQLTDEEIKQTQDRVLAILNEQFEASKSYKPETRDWLTSYWAGALPPPPFTLKEGMQGSPSCRSRR
jgi:2-oxoglutarate dehydrogenase E1 component